jgi:hypothetical protein
MAKKIVGPTLHDRYHNRIARRRLKQPLRLTRSQPSDGYEAFERSLEHWKKLVIATFLLLSLLIGTTSVLLFELGGVILVWEIEFNGAARTFAEPQNPARAKVTATAEVLQTESGACPERSHRPADRQTGVERAQR